MNKFKIVFAIILPIGASIAVFVWLGWSKFAPPKIAEKNFPQKAADILLILPVPKNFTNTELDSHGAAAEIVFVPRVIDGDTIVVEPVDPATGVPGKQETVRYIGMDTPETVSPTKPVECYGHEASARNKGLVDGEYVAIVKDAGDKDKYGRLLRYVYLLNATDTFINLELVKEGFARVLSIPPNTKFESEFSAVAGEARSANLGFWGACSVYPFQ